MGSKTRLVYLDILRLVASFAVIVVHICASYFTVPPVSSFNWQVLNFYDAVCRFCVPVFFMISGALFLNNKKEILLPVLFKKHILRLATAYLFWCALYALAMAVVKRQGFNGFINSFLEGHFHLWFVPVLIVLYMLVPCIKMVAKKSQYFHYLLAVCLLLAVVLPTAGVIPAVAPYIEWLYEKFPVQYFTGYIVYFLLGHYLNTNHFTAFQTKLIYAGGILGTVATITLTAIVSVFKKQPVLIYYEYTFLFVCMASAAIFVWFRNRFGVAGKDNLKIAVFAAKLSPYLFGVYLIHVMWMYFFGALGISPLSFSPVLSVPVLSAVVFLCSLASVWVISKIPLLKRYIM